MTAGRCKWAGCREACAGTHCEQHRVKFNEKEKGAYKRNWRDRVDGKCQKCFYPGHGEEKCEWEPSIRASYETPEQAARRIGR